MRRLSALVAGLLLVGCRSVYGLKLEDPNPPSACPLLRWSPFPSTPQATAAGLVVTYDLKIIRATDGQIAYERRELPEAAHTVETPLEPGVAYHWTVRPRFRREGEVRLGEWSERPSGVRVTRAARVPEPFHDYASFSVPPSGAHRPPTNAR